MTYQLLTSDSVTATATVAPLTESRVRRERVTRDEPKARGAWGEATRQREQKRRNGLLADAFRAAGVKYTRAQWGYASSLVHSGECGYRKAVKLSVARVS